MSSFVWRLTEVLTHVISCNWNFHHQDVISTMLQRPLLETRRQWSTGKASQVYLRVYPYPTRTRRRKSTGTGRRVYTVLPVRNTSFYDSVTRKNFISAFSLTQLVTQLMCQNNTPLSAYVKLHITSLVTKNTCRGQYRQ